MYIYIYCSTLLQNLASEAATAGVIAARAQLDAMRRRHARDAMNVGGSGVNVGGSGVNVGGSGVNGGSSGGGMSGGVYGHVAGLAEATAWRPPNSNISGEC